MRLANRGMPRRHGARGRPPRLLIVAAASLIAGCDILDVNNPNNVTEESLDQASIANALANGALATVTRGVTAIAAPYSTVTDELIWIGSRDAWQQLDFGLLTDAANEFSDGAWPFVTEGRFMADEAIRRLEGFDAEGTLADRNTLARSYLYAAIMYTTIADMYDDFVIGEPGQAAPPVGEANMSTLYDRAVDALNQALAATGATGNTALETTVLAVRARAIHARAIWALLNPPGSTPASPLVNDAAAAADAAAVLARLGAGSDWRFMLQPDNFDVAQAGEISLGYNVNQRGELQIGADYATTDPLDPSEVTGVALRDPIDDVADPAIDAYLDVFLNAGVFTPWPIVSAREMHLILAESMLAQGDEDGAAEHINAVRALNGLTDFDPSNAAHPSALEMLKHERRVNLFLQGRRLADLYRFGEAAEWQASSDAAQAPGTFFPIALIERRSNPEVGG